MSPKISYVTGATGFLGRHLVEQLLKKGYVVYALYRSDEKAKQLKDIIEQSNECTIDNLKLVKGDINDYQSLIDTIPDQQQVYLYHVAAMVALNGDYKENLQQFKVNVEGTANVVEAALKRGVKRIIYTSSIVTFVDVERLPAIVSEQTGQCGIASNMSYARTKYIGELLVNDARTRGMETIIMNPAYIIGRYDDSNMGAYARSILEGQSTVTSDIGGGTFCSGEEVAKAHIVAAEEVASGEQFILGGVHANWKEVTIAFGRASELPNWNDNQVKVISRITIRALSKVTKLISLITGSPNQLGDGDVKMLLTRFYVDNSKAVNMLGFKSDVTLEEMAKDCINWLKKQKK